MHLQVEASNPRSSPAKEGGKGHTEEAGETDTAVA